jgi:hypothetical protein
MLERDVAKAAVAQKTTPDRYSLMWRELLWPTRPRWIVITGKRR